jgi:hypothetical protein
MFWKIDNHRYSATNNVKKLQIFSFQLCFIGGVEGGGLPSAQPNRDNLKFKACLLHLLEAAQPNLRPAILMLSCFDLKLVPLNPNNSVQ